MAQHITLIEDPRTCFRKYDILCHFFSPKTAKRAIYAGALVNALELGTVLHPTVAAWNEACKRLYGASLHAETRMYRHQIDIVLSFSSIADEILGVNNFKAVTELFKEMVFTPLFCDNHDATAINVINQVNFIRHQNLLALKDNPSDYALFQAGKIAYQETDYALDALGTLEEVDDISQKELCDFYHDILKHSYIVICANGNYNKSELKEFVESLDLTSCPQPSHEQFYVLGAEDFMSYPLKKEILPINQSAISQIYRTHAAKTPQNIALFNVLTEYLTGQTDSILFQKIREQMGICYRIQATAALVYTLDLNINVGLNKSNIERTLKQIALELNAIKEGTIDSKLFDYARNNVIDNLKGLNDSMYDETNNQLIKHLRGFVSSIEEAMVLYQALKPEDLVDFLKTYELVSTFVLESE